MQPTVIKWVLAHEPIEIFIRAAEHFAKVVEEKAPGQVKIEILTLSEYSQKYNNGVKITKHQLLDLMDAGKIEMSQMYTYVLSKYNEDLNALDMPFLFESHEHAARVFEGPIGQELLAGYEKNSNIKGMAFTYSGGFMNVPLDKDISSLSEMAGVRVRVSNSPVAIDTWTALGADPVVMDIEELANGMEDGRVNGGESSWPRIYPCGQDKVADSIIDSGHRLLLTNIIINSDFFAGLSDYLKAIMMDAAVEAARVERAISVADVEPTSARATKDGIRVFKLSTEDQTFFKSATEQVYEKYENYFTPGLIGKIQQAK